MKLALLASLLALAGCYYYEDGEYYRPSVGVTVTPGYWGGYGGYRGYGYGYRDYNYYRPYRPYRYYNRRYYR